MSPTCSPSSRRHSQVSLLPRAVSLCIRPGITFEAIQLIKRATAVLRELTVTVLPSCFYHAAGVASPPVGSFAFLAGCSNLVHLTYHGDRETPELSFPSSIVRLATHTLRPAEALLIPEHSSLRHLVLRRHSFGELRDACWGWIAKQQHLEVIDCPNITLRAHTLRQLAEGLRKTLKRVNSNNFKLGSAPNGIMRPGMQLVH